MGSGPSEVASRDRRPRLGTVVARLELGERSSFRRGREGFPRGRKESIERFAGDKKKLRGEVVVVEVVERSVVEEFFSEFIVGEKVAISTLDEKLEEVREFRFGV